MNKVKIIFLILFSWGQHYVWAQGKNLANDAKTDQNVRYNTFTDKQIELNELAESQTFQIQFHKNNLEHEKKRMLSFTQTKLSPATKDSVLAIKKSVLSRRNILKDYYYKWFKQFRNVSAIFTRFGELSELNKADEPMKKCVKTHQDFFESFNQCADLIGFILTEADVALDAKEKTPKIEPSFDEKQKAFVKLLNNQKVPLDKLLANLEHEFTILNQWSELLKYPKKVQEYRMEATDSITNIRKRSSLQESVIKDFYFEWFSFHKHMTVFFVKFGTLTVQEKMDEEMKQFIFKHRDFYVKMEKCISIIDEINKECEYLLFSKLN